MSEDADILGGRLACGIRCAWCGVIFGQSVVAGSEGMCESCFRRLTEIPDLTPTQLDELPFGVIKINGEGVVLSYNQAEASLSCLSPHDVVGRNFFTEVATCTRLQQFQQHYEKFLKSGEPVRNFIFNFRFAHDEVRVRVSLVRINTSRSALITVIKDGGEETI